jgi:formate hydrogenlyase subunit 6/NADH:ubiquinone oxidoreductase subunit I/DNA-binding Lrp family transcriptional regulator
MAQVKDAYQTIAEMWTFPESHSFRKMLEALMTPEEAELLVEAREPVTVPELAERLKVDEKALSEKMDNLAKRGLIFRGKSQYHFKMGLHFGFAGMPASGEYAPSDEYNKWRKIWQDENPDREVKGWLKRYEESGHQVHRVYPSRLAILANPKIKKEDLLWHEDIEQVFRKADIIAAGPCGCRVGGGMGKGGLVNYEDNKGAVCDHPLWNCFQFRKDMAEFNINRGGKMKIYSVEEALEKSDEAERAGLIHEGPTNSANMPGIICSCGADCCQMIISSRASGRIHELYTPSRFQPVVDLEKCSGCQTCVERCPFDAMEMVKPAGSKKMKAHLIEKECMGCGVCVVGCPEKALTYELIRSAEHIPPASEAYRYQAGVAHLK